MQFVNQKIWENWAKKLHQLGLHEFTVTLFKATEPLNFLASQLIYMSQPILNTFVGNETLSALAELLEEPKNTQLFLDVLIEESP